VVSIQGLSDKMLISIFRNLSFLLVSIQGLSDKLLCSLPSVLLSFLGTSVSLSVFSKEHLLAEMNFHPSTFFPPTMLYIIGSISNSTLSTYQCIACYIMFTFVLHIVYLIQVLLQFYHKYTG
jgi:hypothetical protein